MLKKTVEQIITGNNAHYYWKALFGILLVGLFYFTLTPNPPTPIKILNADKFYHFVAFTILTFVFKLAFRKIKTLIIFFIPTLLGVGIEIIQIYMPTRSFGLDDIIADFIGVFCGYYLAKQLTTSNE